MSFFFKFKRLLFIFLHKAFVWSAPQEGEAILLSKIFNSKLLKKGFYVDIGAHHPFRYSNTHIFYQRGWSGINIEPNKEDFNSFKSDRKRDINLNIGVSKLGKHVYYMYNEPALNTIDPNTVKLRSSQGIHYIKKEYIACDTLSNILDINLPRNLKEIDFFNIDVEGNELEVLKTNNWKKYIPKVIVCEILNSNLEDVLNSEITFYLKDRNYNIFSKLYNSVFYVNKKFEKKLNI
jgi:FkbM family methyltransferase